jgi:hypothetical protein
VDVEAKKPRADQRAVGWLPLKERTMSAESVQLHIQLRETSLSSISADHGPALDS